MGGILYALLEIIISPRKRGMGTKKLWLRFKLKSLEITQSNRVYYVWQCEAWESKKKKKETKISYIFAQKHFGGYHNFLQNLKYMPAAHLFYNSVSWRHFLTMVSPQILLLHNISCLWCCCLCCKVNYPNAIYLSLVFS